MRHYLFCLLEVEFRERVKPIANLADVVELHLQSGSVNVKKFNTMNIIFFFLSPTPLLFSVSHLLTASACGGNLPTANWD